MDAAFGKIKHANFSESTTELLKQAAVREHTANALVSGVLLGAQ